MKAQPNIADPDGFYAAWVAAHEGLDDDASNDLNTRFALLLANQIGDDAVLLACLAAAREAAEPDPRNPAS